MQALFKISYGLYVLTARTNKFNGCIINTLSQVQSAPTRVSITVNKDNYTTKMIEETGVFNVSIINEKADFSLFERFGFSSGKTTQKFTGFTAFKMSKNGLPYITQNTNAFISCKVVSKTELDTHICFIAEITEEQVLNDINSLTYDEYFKSVKPKPESNGKYVCKICNYEYNGESIPDDYICPICKHGKEFFIKK